MNNLTKYLTVRPKLSTGDLIEWRSNSIVGWAIRLFTGRNVNHSSLVIKFADQDDLHERRYVLEALGQGVDLNFLSRRLKEFDGEAWWYQLKPKYNRNKALILPWALDQLGTQYDYRSIIAQTVSKVSADGRKFFCSEYYQMAMENAGILPCMTKALRPGDFAELNIHLDPVKIL